MPVLARAARTTAKPPPLLGPHDARPEGPRLVGFCCVPFRYRSSRHREHAPPPPRRRRKDAAALPRVRLAMTRSANTALHCAKPTRLARYQSARTPGHRITGPSSGNARKLAGLRRGLGHAVAPDIGLPCAQFPFWPAHEGRLQSPPRPARDLRARQDSRAPATHETRQTAGLSSARTASGCTLPRGAEAGRLALGNETPS